MNTTVRLTCLAMGVLIVMVWNLGLQGQAVQAQDPTLDAAIFQATSRAWATLAAGQATRAAAQQTSEAVSFQRTSEAMLWTRVADATRQALETQARQQEIILTGTAQAHHESANATATAVSFHSQQQSISATATMQSLHAQAVQQTLGEQAAAGIGVMVLSLAIAIMLILVGLGAFKFLKSRVAPVTLVTPGTTTSGVDDVYASQVPHTIVVDVSQPGVAREMAKDIADFLGDRLP